MNEIRMLNGYRTIYFPEHSKALHGTGFEGFVYEHVLIAEKFMGRPLLEKEVVHHLDENRSNNRESNLIVLEESQHSKLHAWLNIHNPYVAVKTIPVEPSYCIICGKTLQAKQTKYCNKYCLLKGKERANKPTKEQLIEDIKELPFTRIGDKYDVTDNAVRKWARNYGIPLKKRNIPECFKDENGILKQLNN